MITKIPSASAACLLTLPLLALATQAAAVDYKSQVMPIFKAKCFECHSEAKGKVKGKLSMDPEVGLSSHIGPGKNIVPGEPEKSSMVISVKLPDDDDDVMPPKGKNRLSPAEVATLESWIREGASLTGAGSAAAAPTLAPASEAAPMKWTNTGGTEIEAIFMGLRPDGVLLKIPSTGIVHIVPLDKLSAASQEQAKKAAAP